MNVKYMVPILGTETRVDDLCAKTARGILSSVLSLDYPDSSHGYSETQFFSSVELQARCLECTRWVEKLFLARIIGYVGIVHG